jgi:hypothetical protein
MIQYFFSRLSAFSRMGSNAEGIDLSHPEDLTNYGTKVNNCLQIQHSYSVLLNNVF